MRAGAVRWNVNTTFSRVHSIAVLVSKASHLPLLYDQIPRSGEGTQGDDVMLREARRAFNLQGPHPRTENHRTSQSGTAGLAKAEIPMVNQF